MDQPMCWGKQGGHVAAQRVKAEWGQLRVHRRSPDRRGLRELLVRRCLELGHTCRVAVSAIWCAEVQRGARQRLGCGMCLAASGKRDPGRVPSGRTVCWCTLLPGSCIYRLLVRHISRSRFCNRSALFNHVPKTGEQVSCDVICYGKTGVLQGSLGMYAELCVTKQHHECTHAHSDTRVQCR
jgi:hypothetical protein